MHNRNYFVIQGWMINDLQLKGVELLVYAIIYGFCQDGSKFTGTNTYLSSAASASVRAISSAITGLQDKGLISVTMEPLDEYTNQTKRTINLLWVSKNCMPPRKKVAQTDAKTACPHAKTANNNIDNNIVNNIDNKRACFIKPTVQEIQDYAASQNLSIDAEQFFDYYEANGWRVGSHKMKDWKATVRNWARRSFGNQSQTTESFSEYAITPDEVF